MAKKKAARKPAKKSAKKAVRKSPAKRREARPKRSARRAPRRSGPALAQAPVLLSGGNPQIAKGDGDAPVRAYIAAMPGWKRAVGEWIDELVTRNVPGVRKAVKWNSPFYGMAGQGWFLSLHCFNRFVRIGFFRGASLTPLPPGPSKQPNVRYLDIREGEQPDSRQVASWLRQAAAIPGWLADQGVSTRPGSLPPALVAGVLLVEPA